MLQYFTHKLHVLLFKIVKGFSYIIVIEPIERRAIGAQMERVENASAFLKGHVHRKQENNQEKSTTAAEENDDTFSEVDSGVDAEGEDVDDEYDDYARRDQTHLDRHIFEGQTGTDMNMNPSSPSVEGMSSAEDEENSIDTKSSTDTDSRWEAPSDVVEEADFETLERSCCTFVISSAILFISTLTLIQDFAVTTKITIRARILKNVLNV